MNPDVDLVIMSKAATNELHYMTQRAINSAKYGALPLVVNAIVMEQTERQFTNAETVHVPGTFNYNEFANRGAKMGEAPWIVFANNDLRFEDNWLQELLRANTPVASPLSPGYHRHCNVLGNERGWQVGRNLSGWCYIMARWLWNELGGLDESYPFWCADNAVMDQLRTYGVMPMLVRDAVVHHMVSATLFGESRDVQDELTWAQLHQYNQETGQDHLANDRRYRMWKSRRGIQ